MKRARRKILLRLRQHYVPLLSAVGFTLLAAGITIVILILSTYSSSQLPEILMEATNADFASNPPNVDLVVLMDRCHVSELEFAPSCRITIELENTSLRSPYFYFHLSGTAGLEGTDSNLNEKATVNSTTTASGTSMGIYYPDKSEPYGYLAISFNWNPFSSSDYDRYALNLRFSVENLHVRNYFFQFVSPIVPTEISFIYPEPSSISERQITWSGRELSSPFLPPDAQLKSIEMVVHLPSLEVTREYWTTVGSVFSGVGVTMFLEGALEAIRGAARLGESGLPRI